ncbi:MAG TPA: DUF1573 domain-containing protein [Blastocatellia bacterium]|nr:DUF1573 domain-containing protein [Blastocatellia bacterium]
MKFMKVFPAFALAILLAVSAAAQEKQQPKQAEGTPKLAIESPTHDFGEVKPGTPLRYAFKIKNEGKADLMILTVTPG